MATVKSDDQGNTWIAKRDRNNAARDDAAAALLLACGGLTRFLKRRRGGFRYVGIAA